MNKPSYTFDQVVELIIEAKTDDDMKVIHDVVLEEKKRYSLHQLNLIQQLGLMKWKSRMFDKHNHK